MERTYVVYRRDSAEGALPPAAPVDHALWGGSFGIEANAYLTYDDLALYVTLVARERDIRSEEHGPLGMPCNDSCLEFFLCPVPGDRRYLNMEFSPSGCMYLGLGSGNETLVRLLPETDGFGVKTRLLPETDEAGDETRLLPETDVFGVEERLLPEADEAGDETQACHGGWLVSFTLPHEFVRRFFPSYRPCPGEALRANFYKCGDRTKNPHYLAWNEVVSDKPAFHLPDQFGRIVFA